MRVAGWSTKLIRSVAARQPPFCSPGSTGWCSAMCTSMPPSSAAGLSLANSVSSYRAISVVPNGGSGQSTIHRNCDELGRSVDSSRDRSPNTLPDCTGTAHGTSAATHVDARLATLPVSPQGIRNSQRRGSPRKDDAIKRDKSRADIARGFRVLKSEIETGPTYHRRPDRIRARASMCFVALTLYRVMRSRLHATSHTGLSAERSLSRRRRIQHHRVALNGAQPVAGHSSISQDQADILSTLTIKKPTLDAQSTLL